MKYNFSASQMRVLITINNDSLDQYLYSKSMLLVMAIWSSSQWSEKTTASCSGCIPYLTLARYLDQLFSWVQAFKNNVWLIVSWSASFRMLLWKTCYVAPRVVDFFNVVIIPTCLAATPKKNILSLIGVWVFNVTVAIARVKYLLHSKA